MNSYMYRLLVLLLGEISLILAADTSAEPGEIYYVKPSKTTKCPGQPCETLNEYLDNMASEINRQKNVTMLFLNGTHSLADRAQPPLITISVIRMIGESEKVTVVASDLERNALAYHLILMDHIEVTFQNLVIINLKSKVLMDLDSLTPVTFNVVSSTMQNCWFETSEAHAQVRIEQSVLQGGRYNFRSNAMFKTSRFENINMLIENELKAEDSMFLNTPILAQNIHVFLSGTTVLSSTNMTSAITSRYSNITLSGHISFVNNSGIRGAAIALHSSTLSIAANAIVTFANNSAKQKGGAIYIEPGVVPSMVINSQAPPTCFFELLNCNATPPSYNLYFANNSAFHGGNDIYGASPFEVYCLRKYTYPWQIIRCNLTVHRSTPSNSSVSSDPLRVCLCDKDGVTLCENNSYTLLNYTVYPGEIFTIPVVLVGEDFGLTTGNVYANIFPALHYNTVTSSLSPYVSLVSSVKQCSGVTLSVYSQANNSVLVYLTTVQLDFIKTLQPSTSQCKSSSCFLTAPIFINFTVLPCPPGFALLGDPPRCDCYPVLTNDLNVTCHLANGVGFFSWTGSLWLDVKENVVIYDGYCPYNYCYKGSKVIDLVDTLDSQCDHSRAGILCGGCKGNYSLAIGSSNCLLCSNSNNLALLIFFAAAGLLLVFIISVLNLTVTQGLVNGLIFYSNIVWTYKEIILFTPESHNNPVLVFLKIFIAWVNLDFGIETCFVEGLTAFWKTWLQFVFPVYIFSIAGGIIVAARYSSRLTKLFGSRAVPLLATLFLLSYMKLLRTAVSALEFSILTYSKYPNGSSSEVVWSVDGNLSYFQFPHILLFLVGLATLLFLWLPYTLLLLLMQWLRRLPSVLFLRWIMRLHPLYDAYFAPLKHKHQYWFGVLLLTRGILLVTFASTFAIPQNINLVLLLVFGMLLIYLMVLTHPYKSRGVLILQISYLANLTLLSGFIFFTYTQENGTELQVTTVGLSTGVVFLQFCGTVLYAVIKPRCCQRKTKQIKEDDAFDDNSYTNRVGEPALAEHSGRYCDSILNESQPLLPTY